jgi:hypothetical protein
MIVGGDYKSTCVIMNGDESQHSSLVSSVKSNDRRVGSDGGKMTSPNSSSFEDERDPCLAHSSTIALSSLERRGKQSSGTSW